VPSQSERRDATRQAIIAAARHLFGTRGFADTSVDDLLTAAGVSKGAMYHHFAAKDSVFEAVFRATSEDAVRRSASHIRTDATPMDALVQGCLGWITEVDDPEVRQILLIDGPAALGWERARSIEEESSLRVMQVSLQRAVRSGELRVASVPVAARLLNALLAEAALNVQPGNRRSRKIANDLIEALVNGMRVAQAR
jgi:AcrR family transcriptional regulator